MQILQRLQCTDLSSIPIDFMIQNKLGLEFALKADDLDQHSPCKENLLNLKNKFPIKVPLLHAPFSNLSLVSDDDYIVSYSLATLKKALDFCNDCAIPAMIFHSGLNPYILNYSIPKLYPTFKTALAQLVAYAITKKISLLIENTYELECLDFISRVLADFPEISLAFDLGHAACFSDLAIQKWFTALQPRMKHIHLHDNNLTQDQHLNLGEGVIPFASFQKNMIQVGSLTMETSLENIQDNFTYLTSHILTGGTKP